MDDDDPKPDSVTPSPPLPPSRDLENNQTAPQNSGAGVVSNILRRWKREDLLKKASLTLRTLAFLFSFLAFIIMASNKHGDWREYNKYEEYRYVLAIAILSTFYTGFQVLRQLHELHTARETLPRRTLAIIDFSGDQLAAYFLISAASSAVPLTNRMREGADNIFTDSSAAAISMEFFAFFSLGLSAIVSGCKLSKQTYI
ncbi:CASP-like protein 4B4 [Sesamum alatum]|uniref:CASP-like protein n=1 Tax=Sesamum alatum TaxID=300844 RepID=A0AAE1YMC8_9LAMI|nr:CASP-like protein 4B4 [Sesamum alatum]